jgi:hypothetical protein
MRVFRTIFLLAIAAFFMPSPPENPMAMLPETEDPPATAFLTAAVSTVADMSDFCSRQAAVCDTAHYLAVKFEGKAKYGIELLYEWARESNGPAQSGSYATAVDEPAAAGRNTLQLEDLIPEWRAPKPAQG